MWDRVACGVGELEKGGSERFVQDEVWERGGRGWDCS